MILVFGKTGQVATELQTLLPDATFLGRDQADLTDPYACFAAIMTLKPEAVINAAAYTAVDKAEEDEDTAALVNGTAPAEMAKACAALDIPFVHISTDYVFDGTGDMPFATDHPTAPLGAYGRTKLMGEDGIRNVAGSFVILRTSWVFSAHGGNFLKSMLRLGAGRDKLTIVADQIGGPTPARAIAEACVNIAERLKKDPNTAGTYHFSGAPDVSWADFARAIFDAAKITCVVEDIPTSAYPTPAKRPANSRMDCSTTTDVFGITRPNWRDAVRITLQELENSQ
ncbi:dTDP-4-dehydrorhamnose reductase [Pacificibacter marinus]|uniref:dTDP-4-dehydrorhamnose reductase n=1 Tax=Pacificibacter marinus TaxID=658057 RepID=A0A1Y5TBL1_9RHOB|nr:dTDP-4-dehydrorhamnose reductase [Pacificibacter marinus]SEL07700.1 dTDP-4-dehydrorhamnose reductase [Pacificibacter marinus]SLN60080.1 dTDP-4-dehydrorhamnose reductase [Pacificibacter marinus]